MIQRPIIAFDIDFTLHRGSLVVLLLQAMVERGLIPRDVSEHASVMEHKHQVHQGLRRDYAYAMIDQFVILKALEGIPESQMHEIAESLLEEHSPQTHLFPRLLLAAAKRRGYVTVAISGSPKQIVEVFAKNWGFDDCLATEFLVTPDGRLTGSFDEWIRYHTDKASALKKLAEKHNCHLEGSIAIGDSLDDLGMMNVVTYPIALNPSNELRDKCRELQIPFALEQGDGVILFKSAVSGGAFQEIDVRDGLPQDMADEIFEMSERRVCRIEGVH